MYASGDSVRRLYSRQGAGLAERRASCGNSSRMASRLEEGVLGPNSSWNRAAMVWSGVSKPASSCRPFHLFRRIHLA